MPPHKPSGTRPSGRNIGVRVKTSAKRSVSSTRWLERQLNDPYVAEAHKLGLRSRAAFKLMQLDERFHLLARGRRVVDLGAAPGGWTEVVVKKVGDGGKVVALDILEMAPVAGASVMQADFLDETVPERLRALLDGPADIVLSDMAAPTTGHQATDHLRIMALAEAAYVFAAEVLAPGGAFICKLFQGGAERDLLEQLKRDFVQVRHAKPPASRADSAETYIVATGFRRS
ncbi:MAG: RlmE family RNA methyltransferase [Azospirillaceae bacterium]|nr:RlmE family RNA methyltransferase [Azospirillaceae bacterium]